MSITPGTRSRTSSRSATPGPISHLVVSHVLKSTRSLTNLNIHAPSSPSRFNNTHASASPPSQVLDSSASSVTNLDISEGILIQDADAEADTAEAEEAPVMGVLESAAGGDESKKTLRDHLRKTLNQRQSGSGSLHYRESSNDVQTLIYMRNMRKTSQLHVLGGRARMWTFGKFSMTLVGVLLVCFVFCEIINLIPHSFSLSTSRVLHSYRRW
jgi:hypothetical protein